jgi:hypothetical protein
MSQLILVKEDKEYRRVRRRGRIQIPAGCARSPRHFAAAIDLAKRLLVQQLEAEGKVFVDQGWEVRGPLPHIAHFLGDGADPGPLVEMPEITNLGYFDADAMDAYERAENARRAWAVGEATDMEDYRVIGTFEAPVETHYRAHVKDLLR